MKELQEENKLLREELDKCRRQMNAQRSLESLLAEIPGLLNDVKNLRESQPQTGAEHSRKEIQSWAKTPQRMLQDLMSQSFTRDEMAAHSLTGKKSNANGSLPPRPQLDPEKMEQLFIMDPKYLREWRRLRDRVDALAASSSSLSDFPDFNVHSQEDVSGEGPSMQGDVSVFEGSSVQSHLFAEGLSSGVHTEEDSSAGDGSLIEDLDYGYKETADSSDSNTERDSSDSDEDTPSLHKDLAEWATTTGQTHVALNKLLGILRTHGHTLPKDSRTLLSTPSGFEIKNVCGGQYTYYGLEPGILQCLSIKTTFASSIDLIINIDGLPIFKSSKTHFWPILAKFDDAEPFLVALYYGNSKPDPVHDYLCDLVAELQNLMHNGVSHKTKVHKVTLRAFIYDAPARAFLKCIKSHNALHGCERCLSVGTSVAGRVVHLNKVPCEKITGEKFRQFQYPNHQKEPTPLAQLGINCVTQFPLDHMHLIFLGAVKRLLTFLLRGPAICRLQKGQSDQISQKLVQLKGLMPAEFVRQPRSLTELDRWKATELRQFLLYTGPLVLLDVLSQDHYHHFLSLTIGMSILLDENDNRRGHYLEYAQNLLQHFVDSSSELYGETFPTYNIHSIKHVADDVFNFRYTTNTTPALSNSGTNAPQSEVPGPLKDEIHKLLALIAPHAGVPGSLKDQIPRLLPLSAPQSGVPGPHKHEIHKLLALGTPQPGVQGPHKGQKRKLLALDAPQSRVPGPHKDETHKRTSVRSPRTPQGQNPQGKHGLALPNVFDAEVVKYSYFITAAGSRITSFLSPRSTQAPDPQAAVTLRTSGRSPGIPQGRNPQS
ncbi:hypothetical protein QQF64_035779 [Cirrhinus molitorella]|uniref:BEN domain-containing protein n=1 Tax=Cirrhinus molitorella TaxID=172907 RepID=A0ABR3NHG8_9TELE